VRRRRRRGRLAKDEFYGNGSFLAWHQAILDAGQQKFCSPLAQSPEIDVNCRQRRESILCLLKIVEANDRHVPSRDHSLLVKGAHRPYCKQVAEADDRRQFRRDLQELAHADITLVPAWRTDVLPKVAWSKAMLQQDLAISPYSPASRRRVRATSHPADRLVSERNEMCDRRGQTLLIFNADPIEGAASYFAPRDNNGQPLAEGLQVPGCRADCRADDEARDIALD
jgi:hypothetical protein